MIISPLKAWVQNILPVVYDDSLSYLEIVAKINAKTNNIISQTNENTNAIETLAETIAELGDIDELRALLDEMQDIVENLYTTDDPLMDGTASAGSADHAARSDHVHPSDTNKAPVNHASNVNTYGIGDANNYGHVKITDNINNNDPGTGVKASVVKTVNNKLSTFAKDNLLDNWYFVGGGSQLGSGQFPINQRGQTSYSAGYSIDRWTVVNTSMALTNNGITLYGLKQLLEKSRIVDGLIYTLSVYCSTGVFSATAILNSEAGNSWQIDQAFNGGWFGVRFTGGTWEIRITSSNDTVFYAVKLELGSEQTLAHIENSAWLLNEMPNYEQELLKCQRYCIVYKTSSNTRSLLALGIAESTTQYRAPLPTPVTMRHSDQRSVDLVGTIVAGSLTASSVASYWEENPGSITLFVNVTGATVDNVAKIMLEQGSTLTISADL